MIHVSGFPSRMGGWGTIVRGLAQALDQLEPVTLHSWDHPPAPPDSCASGVGLGLGPWQNMNHLVGAPRVAAVCNETTRVPAEWLRFVERADQIWAPTAWGREVLIESGLPTERLRVVPYGVDANTFRPSPSELSPSEPSPSGSSPSGSSSSGSSPSGAPRPFRFVAVGKWEERKGIAQLARCFREEFDHREVAAQGGVELHLQCFNPYCPDLDLHHQLDKIKQQTPAGPPIHLGEPVGDEALVELLQSSDAFVLPTRGEGWGLPILEAMACGLPAIVTDHGAHRVFARPETAYLIRVDRLCPVDDPTFFDSRLDWGQWAEPDWPHLRHLLRRVFEHRDESAAIGRAARREALRWSWENAAAIAHRELNSL